MPYMDFHAAVVGHKARYMIGVHPLLASQESPLCMRVIAEALATRHKNCPCGRAISRDTIWKADLPWIVDHKYLLEDFQPRDDTLVDPASTVQDLYGDQVPPRKCANLVFGLDPPVEPGQRGALFTGVRRLNGNICRVAGVYSRLSLPSTTRYSDFSIVPGTVFVDKSDFITPRYGLEDNPDPSVPIIRRPAGFGKTTFLSMVASWFDAADRQRQFPYSRTGGRVSGPQYPALLVLWFDFAVLAKRLPRGREATHSAIYNACAEFMAASFEEFYQKYAVLLTDNRPRSFPRDARFWHRCPGFQSWVSRCGYSVFLAVDNYTAPFAALQGYARLDCEYEIWVNILGPLLSERGRFIWRGLITGLDLDDFVPFAGDRYACFQQLTEDLTHVPAFTDTIGFSYQDVTDLGHVLVDNDVDLAARMNVTGSVHEDHMKSTFSAQGVVSLLSQLMNGDPLEQVLAEEPRIDSFMPSSSSPPDDDEMEEVDCTEYL